MIDSRILGLIGLALAAALTFVACQMLGFLGLFAAPAVFGMLLLTGSPMRLIAAFWFVTILAPAAEVVLPSVLVKSTEQILGLYILALLAGDLLMTRRPIPGTRVVIFVLVGLLVLTGVAAVVNPISKTSLLFAAMTYFKHLWVFLYTLRHVENKHVPFVFGGMLAGFGLQVLLNIAAVTGLSPLPYLFARGAADHHLGSIGDSHAVGYYMIVGVLLLVSFARHRPSFGNRIMAYIGIGLALIQFFFTFTMHGYPILAAALGLQYVLFARKRIMHLWTAGIGLAAVVLLFALLFALEPFKGLETQILTRRSFNFQWHRLRTGPKWEAHREVFFRAGEHLRYPFVGAGLGNYTSRVAYLGDRPLSRLPHMSYFYRTNRPEIRMGGSIMGSPRTGYVSLFGELGPLGLLLFWGLYVYAMIRVKRQLTAGLYRERRELALAEAFVPTILVFMALNLLIDLESTLHLTVGLWVWAGCLWNREAIPSDTKAVASIESGTAAGGV